VDHIELRTGDSFEPGVLMQLERAVPVYHLSPITRSIQDRSMQQNNGHLQPSFDVLSKQRVCKAHQQARPDPPSRAADCKERHEPTNATAITVKQTKVEKKRPQVAFGCCLPRNPSVAEPRAAPSKLPRSHVAPPATPSSAEETCNVMSSAIDRSCQPPALVQDADLCAAAPSEPMPGDTDASTDGLVPVFARTALSFKPHLNQQHRWPHVERALFKFRQRHQLTRAEQPESAAPNLHRPLPDRCPAATQQDAVGVSDAASDRAHSLTLLGFSDSRTRHASSWLLVPLPLTCFYSDATAISRVVAATQVPSICGSAAAVLNTLQLLRVLQSACLRFAFARRLQAARVLLAHARRAIACVNTAAWTAFRAIGRSVAPFPRFVSPFLSFLQAVGSSRMVPSHHRIRRIIFFSQKSPVW
jgi:hypothetical protein